MPLFSKKDKTQSNQVAKIESMKSQKWLLEQITNRANGASDSETRNLLIQLANKIKDFPVCADSRAKELDEKILILTDTFLDSMFKVDKDAIGGDKTTEVINNYKSQANAKMFAECWQVLEQQLLDRRRLTDGLDKSAKEIKKMSTVAKANYEKKLNARKQIDDIWTVQISTMEYNMKLANIYCQKQFKERQMQDLVSRAASDEGNAVSLGLKYDALEREMQMLTESEESLYNEIQSNAGINTLINKNALVALYNINNSNTGLGIASMVARLSKEAVDLLDTYEEDAAKKKAALDRGLNAHKNAAPEKVERSSSFAEKVEAQKLSNANSQASSSFAQKVAEQKAKNNTGE